MPENGAYFDHPPTQTQKSVMLVDTLFKTNRQVLSGAYPGEGKSIFGHFLSYCIAYEAPFADIFGVTPGNVLIIDAENEWDVQEERASKIKRGLEMDGYTKKHKIWWEPHPKFLLEDDTTWQPILDIIDDLKPIMILLDHLRAFHLLNEDKSNSMTKVNGGLLILQTRQGSALFINHHLNKKDIRGKFRDRLRGSSAILANSDIAIEVRALSRKRIGDKDYLEKFGIIFQPRQELTPSPMMLRIEEGTDYMKLHYEGDYHPVDDPRIDDLAHRFYHLFINPGVEKVLTVNMVRKKIQGYCSDTELRLCLRFLEYNRGLITANRKGLGGGFHYRLTTTSGLCPWCRQNYVV